MPDSILNWLDRHPSSYDVVATVTVIGALILTVLALLHPDDDATRRHDWRWGAMLVVVLLAGRWPTFFVTREFNVDESRHMAGAHALTHDPMFWRSVDGATSGPLNYFVLCPAGAVFGWDSYAGARVTAVVLLGLSFFLLHQALALGFGRGVARAAGLGAVLFEAFTQSLDFLHQSTELLPLALLMGAVYAAARRWLLASGQACNALGGILLGIIPFTKLQAVPLAGSIGLAWVIAECVVREGPRGRRLAWLIAGALLPAVTGAFYLTFARLWPDFVFAYIESNTRYVSEGDTTGATLAWLFFRRSFWENGLMERWLLVSLVQGCLLLRWRLHRPTALAVLAAFSLCLIAAGSILAPGRAYLHYAHFLILPVPILLAALLAHFRAAAPAAWGRSGRWFAVVLVVTGTIGLLSRQAALPTHTLGSLVYYRQNPGSELAKRVAAQGHQGDSLAIWGWLNSIYVETGMWPAARETDFETLVSRRPSRDAYRERFLADLARQRPPLFLDASGPSSLTIKSPEFRPEQDFPVLADWIRDNYVLVDEFAGARIYRRRDLAGR